MRNANAQVKSAICNVDADISKRNTQHTAASPCRYAANSRWPSRCMPIVFLVSVANLWDYMKHSCRASVHIYRPTMYGMDHLALHSSSIHFIFIDIFRILVGCTWTVRNCCVPIRLVGVEHHATAKNGAKTATTLNFDHALASDGN